MGPSKQRILNRGVCLLMAILSVLLFAGAVAADAAARPRTRLVLVGGGDRPADAMRWFVAEAGGPRANILVVTWATEYPKESFDGLASDFAPFSPAKVVASPEAPLTSDERVQLLDQLSGATGVFFSGGDQVRVMDVLRDTELLALLRKKFADGVVFGGTSAGTAIMSKVMITGNGKFDVLDGAQVETKEGLGLLPDDVIVDQHFIARQRQNRLIGLLMQHGGTTGMGVDENTAVLVVDGQHAEVVGASKVMLFQPQHGGEAFSMRVFAPGDKFDIRNAGATNRPSRSE